MIFFLGVQVVIDPHTVVYFVNTCDQHDKNDGDAMMMLNYSLPGARVENKERGVKIKSMFYSHNRYILKYFKIE